MANEDISLVQTVRQYGLGGISMLVSPIIDTMFNKYAKNIVIIYL